MRKRDLDKFKKLLLQERNEITEHLAKLEGDSEMELSQGGSDPVDLAAVEITQTNIQKLGNREKKLLSKIDYALKKIEDNNFGICERCGEDIAPARLEARPVTQYCIDCKTELEQNERRYSDSEEESEDEMWEGEGGSFDDGSS